MREQPTPIDQHHGLIAHVDIDAGTIELVHVDLDAGRTLGGECVVMAKQWERAEPFSIRHLSSGSGRAPVEPDRSEGGDGDPVPSPPRTPADEQDAVRSRPAPDEGDTVDEYDALQRRYEVLSTIGRDWIKARTVEAQQAGVPFHLRANKTLRRWEILRALVLLAEDYGADIDTEIGETAVRGLLEAVIGDVAQFPTVPLGHLIGSLSSTEATQFSGLLDGRYVLLFTEQGRPTLREAA